MEAKFKDDKEYFCEDLYLTDKKTVTRDQKEVFMRLNSEEWTGPTIFKKIGEHKISPGSATFVSIASDNEMPIPEWLIRCANKPGHYNEGGPEGTKAAVIKGKRLPNDFDRLYAMEDFPTVTIWREMRGRWQIVVNRLSRVPKEEMRKQIALGKCSRIAVVFHPKFEDITDVAEGEPIFNEKWNAKRRKNERKDHWIESLNAWTRIHVKLRKSMFTPCGTKDGARH